MLDLVMAPFAAGIGLMVLFVVFLTFYALYDVLVNQEEMQGLEKLIWVAAIFSFNLFGVIAYFIIVKGDGVMLLEPRTVKQERNRMEDLERLKDLREADVLTEEEFKEEKRKILEGE